MAAEITAAMDVVTSVNVTNVLNNIVTLACQSTLTAAVIATIQTMKILNKH